MRNKAKSRMGANVFDAPRQHHVPSPRLGSPEARVFRILTSSAFRKGSISQMDLARLGPQLLTAINGKIRSGEPIQLTLMAFPFKVPNPAKSGGRALPDQAELASIRRLAELAAEVRNVYTPGLVVELIHDGAFIADVFGVDLEEVRAYEAYFAGLVDRAGAHDVIRCHDFEALQSRAGLSTGPAIEAIQREAKAWWASTRDTPDWRDCFRKTFGMLDIRDVDAETAARLLEDAKTGTLPARFTLLEARIHRAMIGYRVKDALIHAFDPRGLVFPGAIHATTRVQPNRLALWLVRRGDALLPWHGVGVTDRDGAVRVMHARDALDRGFRPNFLAGEPTPFCYRDPAGSCS
jgi:hypothetical protein